MADRWDPRSCSSRGQLIPTTASPLIAVTGVAAKSLLDQFVEGRLVLTHVPLDERHATFGEGTPSLCHRTVSPAVSIRRPIWALFPSPPRSVRQTTAKYFLACFC